MTLLCRAYDGRKNVFTPTEFSFGAGPHTYTVMVADPLAPGAAAPAAAEPIGQSFRITMKQVATIDLGTIEHFVQGRRQGLTLENSVLNAITSVNILLRQDPADRYTPVGRGGQRFFPRETGSTPIPSGGVVAAGFMQSFRPCIRTAAVQIDTAYSAFLQPGPMLEVAARILGHNANAGFREHHRSIPIGSRADFVLRRRRPWWRSWRSRRASRSWWPRRLPKRRWWWWWW